MEEVKIIDGEEWVRKPVSSTPKTDWEKEYNKFCDGDCPRCPIFRIHGNDDTTPCEIIWLQTYARVPSEKKEEYLVEIKEYLKHKQSNMILDAERELETTRNEADKCAHTFADVLSLICDSTTDKVDIPPLVFRMLDLTKEVGLAYKKVINAAKNLDWVHDKLRKENTNGSIM